MKFLSRERKGSIKEGFRKRREEKNKVYNSDKKAKNIVTSTKECQEGTLEKNELKKRAAEDEGQKPKRVALETNEDNKLANDNLPKSPSLNADQQMVINHFFHFRILVKLLPPFLLIHL